MTDAIVDANGVATIPKEVLEKLNAMPGDRLQFSVTHDGFVLMWAKNRSISELAGILYKEGRPRVPTKKLSL